MRVGRSEFTKRYRPQQQDSLRRSAAKTLQDTQDILNGPDAYGRSPEGTGGVEGSPALDVLRSIHRLKQLPRSALTHEQCRLVHTKDICRQITQTAAAVYSLELEADADDRPSDANLASPVNAMGAHTNARGIWEYA